jgi:uncharacterized membrane protein YdbT with pleckstrin-like domain
VSIDYLSKQLGDNERILHTERHHWVFPLTALVRWLLVALALVVIVVASDIWVLPTAGWIKWGYLILLVPLARIAWGFVAWRVNVYAITNRRVFEVSGVFNKRVSDSSLEKLTDVILTQSLLGRMLGYGTIEVLTAASSAGVNDLEQLANPMEFKTAMVNAKEQLEQEFGGSN